MIYGGVAHLGERLNGIQEVRGSIPLISTTNQIASAIWFFVFRAVSASGCLLRLFYVTIPMRKTA